MYIKNNELFKIVQYMVGSAEGNTVEITIQRLSDNKYWDFTEEEFVVAESNGEMTWQNNGIWVSGFTPTKDDVYVVYMANTTLSEYYVQTVRSLVEIITSSWDATTKLKICNMALRSLGVARITDFVTDNEQTRVLNDVYDMLLDEILMSHPWNFATKRASLDQNVTAPVYEYTYAFDLPADCLRILETENNVEYQQEGNLLLTNDSSMKIRYIARITDSSKYSSTFVSAFSARIAVEVAYPLTGDPTVAKIKQDEYMMKYSQAKSYNGQEGVVRQEDDSSWISERG